MTRERLVEIRDAIHDSSGWQDGCSPDERAEIKRRWERMPGFYSFYDAVCKLIRDAEEDHDYPTC